MIEERGSYARLVCRFLPEIDAITAGEYHRHTPITPAPRTRPAHLITLICPTCNQQFFPKSFAGRPRFCSSPCRRWWHYGPGSRDRT